jgi:urea transport system substrate-binding protein
VHADGGILGKQIEYIQEDGATDWPTFAEKTEKLLTQDCVAAIFGGWTSSSRKAVKPVVEEHNGLFFYPVQ